MEPVVIRTGDVSALSIEEVPDESVDMVFTDPPYAEADRELFGELGKSAAWARAGVFILKVCPPTLIWRHDPRF